MSVTISADVHDSNDMQDDKQNLKSAKNKDKKRKVSMKKDVDVISEKEKVKENKIPDKNIATTPEIQKLREVVNSADNLHRAKKSPNSDDSVLNSKLLEELNKLDQKRKKEPELDRGNLKSISELDMVDNRGSRDSASVIKLDKADRGSKGSLSGFLSSTRRKANPRELKEKQNNLQNLFAKEEQKILQFSRIPSTDVRNNSDGNVTTDSTNSDDIDEVEPDEETYF